jgi:hypothetical protein
MTRFFSLLIGQLNSEEPIINSPAYLANQRLNYSNMGKEQQLKIDNQFSSTSGFDLLENLKSESTMDISLSTLLGEDLGIVSSPESYFSNSTEDDLDDLVTPTETKKHMYPLQDDFVSSFLTESLNGDLMEEDLLSGDSKGRNKRRREQRPVKVEESEETSNGPLDPKKQQRLIKNRESAQLSRERKKSYLKDLEKSVNELQHNNKSLNSKVSTLEDENAKLRDQLLRASRGEKITDLPPPKKQKPNNSKIPLPSYNQMQFLQPNYWMQMFQGGQQQGSTGPKVVLFVALFCVALFLIKSPQEKDMEMNHARVGRILQNMEGDNVAEMKSVHRLFESLNGTVDDKLKETLGNIKVRWSKETEQVTFVFPNSVKVEDGHGGEISISKKLLHEICEQMENCK